jgi:hypothetical protein
MKLTSNRPDTVFRIREQDLGAAPDEGWIDLGCGREVVADVFIRGRYEVAASCPGYREKRVKLVEPIPRFSFRFLDADRSKGGTGLTVSAIRPTQPTSPEPGRSTPAPSANAGRKWAVVVGVSKYQFAGKGNLANLAYADDDAEAVAEVLKQQGWRDSRINLLTNERATMRNVRIALESWLTKAGKDDLIFLYWSGHAFPDPENDTKTYLTCYDTDTRIPATGYRMDRVHATLRERGVRHVVVMADTCHAGKLATRGVTVAPSIRRSFRDAPIPAGTVFMGSVEADRKAIEHTSWRNGAFTHCLLRGLAGAADGFQGVGVKDTVVTMGELRSYMNTVLPEETQKVLGVAVRPVIAAHSDDPGIWQLTLSDE